MTPGVSFCQGARDMASVSMGFIEENPAMPRRETNPESLVSIAYRLKITRLAFGYTQAFMGRLVGAKTHAAWNNYERAIRRISVDHALRLCAVMGVTMDWIYRGNLSGLPPDVGTAIRAQMEKSED